MKIKDNQQFQFGVYGLLVNDGKILVIKKARGPYTGFYDLPGGGVEFGETIEEALKREIDEEVGGILTKSNFLGYNQYFTKYTNTKNIEKEFHHFGLYFDIECNIKDLKVTADGHDSLGAEFIDLKDLNINNCSPMAYPVIEKFTKTYFNGKI